MTFSFHMAPLSARDKEENKRAWKKYIADAKKRDVYKLEPFWTRIVKGLIEDGCIEKDWSC